MSMASGIGSGPDPGSQDPYDRLGLSPGASFEAVQQAKEKCLADLDDDPQARARIESAYDAVLMSRLKERQLGNLSQAAATASQKEEGKAESAAATAGGANALLTRLRNINLPNPEKSSASILPELAWPEGRELTVRLIAGGLALLLLLLSPPGSTELILALSTIAVFFSQVRRGRRPLPSLGWSVVLLAIGLILGGLLLKLLGMMSGVVLPLSGDQLEAIPAVLLLWVGALLFA
ncbi:MAG: CPP1-like family protein [Prochlorococcus sp.]|nr:CPP1-like family protein [Prochlorococcaceae cyanobacterium Fu_MAG_50]